MPVGVVHDLGRRVLGALESFFPFRRPGTYPPPRPFRERRASRAYAGAVADDRFCPACGGPISTAVGMGWRDVTGDVHPWVGTCLSCFSSAGQERAFGIDKSGKLVNVEPFMLDD